MHSTLLMRSRIVRGRWQCLKKTLTSVRCTAKYRGFNPNSGQNIQSTVKNCDYHKIQQDLAKTSEHFLYCKLIFSMYIFNAVLSYSPPYYNGLH